MRFFDIVLRHVLLVRNFKRLGSAQQSALLQERKHTQLVYLP